MFFSKVFDPNFFQKVWQVKGGAIVALRRVRNSPFGVSFLRTFFFAPLAVKEKQQQTIICNFPPQTAAPLSAEIFYEKDVGFYFFSNSFPVIK